MDFTPDEDQAALSALAARIAADHSSPERLREMEADGVDHDAALWTALVNADLVGIAAGEAAGGAGYGVLEGTLVAQALAAHVAFVPYTSVIATVRALDRADGVDHDRLLSDVFGGAIAVPALGEGPTASPGLATRAEPASGDDAAATVTGEKRLVGDTTAATTLVVSATRSGTPGLYAVAIDDADCVAESTTTSGRTLRTFRFERAPARLVADGSEAVDGLLHDLAVLRCAEMAGVADGALALAADHCREREQFGSAIGTFQAVAHRMADAWLDTSLIEATARQAAWRTDHGLPAEQASASACLWACEAGQRVVMAAQHVHGGIGVDLDYPVHRYYRRAKEIELALGGASAAARNLGAAIAAGPLTIG